MLHIRISLSTKFQPKLTILIFWTKFAQKGYFQPKTDQINHTIKLCVFELPNFQITKLPNFILNGQF